MLKFAPKIDMFQAMERRENHKFFKDSAPKKEDIEAILKKAIDLTPVKNSNYDFKVEVYGPEFHAKKRDLLPHTLHHLIDTSFQLNKIKYAEADEITRGLLTSDLPFHTEGNNKYFSFNPQVLAPYLLVFKYSEFQSKSNGERIKNNTLSTDDIWLERSAGYQMNYLAASAMYAYVISVLANSYELDAAFCQCFGYVQDRVSIPLLGDSRHTGFMLGIGTYDRPAFRIPKPSVERVVEWPELTSQLGPKEETYAVAVNNKVEEIINKLLITNGEVDSAERVTELKNTVNNITVKGLSAVPTFLSQDSKYSNASNLILTHKKSIVEEAMTWFKTTYPSVHDEIQFQKCSRDTGYNIDAIVTDLQNGGNFETIAVATRYWDGITSINKKISQLKSSPPVLDALGEELVNLVLEKNSNEIESVGHSQKCNRDLKFVLSAVFDDMKNNNGLRTDLIIKTFDNALFPNGTANELNIIMSSKEFYTKVFQDGDIVAFSKLLEKVCDGIRSNHLLLK